MTPADMAYELCGDSVPNICIYNVIYVHMCTESAHTCTPDNEIMIVHLERKHSQADVENILLSNGTHSMCVSCIERAVLAVYTS